MKRKISADKEELDDTDVVLMNEEMNTSEYHHSGGSMWGIFFLFSGILLLLNTFEIISWDIWHSLLRFWPVLIIVAGVQMILGGGKFAGFLTDVIIFLLFGWAVLIAIHETSPELIQQLPDFFKLPILWWEALIQ
jgi:hypothetical protein